MPADSASATSATGAAWTFAPVTPERWGDFERLFGPRGACGNCWCMFERMARKDFDAASGAERKAAMRALVAGGGVPGLLAYAGAEPVGWCSVAPRETYAALARSRILQPVDDQPVWSLVCFFIAKAARRQGLTVALLRAAVDYAGSRGARIVEGYPKDFASTTTPDVFAWHGTASAFRQAGFREVARRAPTRPIMRYTVGG
ncbi:MAG TPA: GNAT family N-acetyltransferase [Ktedonobacterales bacterium]|nr:GNAT family N-acetyltransferase [Ktedonobacterales bacterium]